MNYKNILALTLFVAVLGVFSFVLQKPWQVFGETAVEDATISTTTPSVADLTVLCGTPGVLDSVNITGPGSGSLILLDATSTTHTDFATTTAVLVHYPTGFGTSTPGNKFGITFKRGLIVDTTAGVATTTISYTCGS